MTNGFRPAHGPGQAGGPGAGALPDNVAIHPRADRAHQLRVVEALLFAASGPLSEDELGACLPEGSDVASLLGELQGAYEARGVNLVKVAGRWAFRTADDLRYLLRHEAVEQKRLSKAALETLSIIAYHQPVTRAEIEEVRGVSTSKGTLDALLEMGWIRMRGRRRTPGRPVTYGTTDAFLEHFGLDSVADLPGMRELKGAGLLDSSLPDDYMMPGQGREEDDLFSGQDEPETETSEEPALEMHMPDGIDGR